MADDGFLRGLEQIAIVNTHTHTCTKPGSERSLLDVAAFLDFIVHEAIERCATHRFAVQIHTGL